MLFLGVLGFDTRPIPQHKLSLGFRSRRSARSPLLASSDTQFPRKSDVVQEFIVASGGHGHVRNSSAEEVDVFEVPETDVRKVVG